MYKGIPLGVTLAYFVEILDLWRRHQRKTKYAWKRLTIDGILHLVKVPDFMRIWSITQGNFINLDPPK